MRNVCAWVSTGGPEEPALSLPLGLLCECLSSLVSEFVLMICNALLTSRHLILNLRFVRVFECILLIYVNFISSLSFLFDIVNKIVAVSLLWTVN